MSSVAIQVNLDRLSNVIKSNLVGFYNQPLTPDIIETLTQQIAETVNEFLNKADIERNDLE